MRQLVHAGALIQRELIEGSQFASAIGRRGGPVSIEQLEEWDRSGALSPRFFDRSRTWTSWRFTDPYPIDGIDFRDERGFIEWQKIGSNSADFDPTSASRHPRVIATTVSQLLLGSFTASG